MLSGVSHLGAALTSDHVPLLLDAVRFLCPQCLPRAGCVLGTTVSAGDEGCSASLSSLHSRWKQTSSHTNTSNCGRCLEGQEYFIVIVAGGQKRLPRICCLNCCLMLTRCEGSEEHAGRGSGACLGRVVREKAQHSTLGI